MRDFERRAMIGAAAGLLLGGSGAGFAAAAPTDATSMQTGACALGFVTLAPVSGGMRVAGRALGLTDCKGKAKLTIDRSGAAGRAAMRQGGAFHVASGETAELAAATISVAAGDRLTARLVLISGGRTIATSEVSTDE